MRSFRRSTYLPKDLANQLYGSTQAFGNTAASRQTYGSKRLSLTTEATAPAIQAAAAPSLQVAQPSPAMSAAA